MPDHHGGESTDNLEFALYNCEIIIIPIDVKEETKKKRDNTSAKYVSMVVFGCHGNSSIFFFLSIGMFQNCLLTNRHRNGLHISRHGNEDDHPKYR